MRCHRQTSSPVSADVLGVAAAAVASLILVGCASDADAPPTQPPAAVVGTEGLVDAPVTEAQPVEDSARSAAPATQPDSTAPVQADTSPETEDVVDTEGYRTVGGTISEINGRPIYTADVVGPILGDLRGLARELPREQYRMAAVRRIRDSLQLRTNSEMLREVSLRNTTAREKQQAEQLAVQWRINFITDAGGSEAVARQRALEEQGISLDRFAEDQYYRFLYLIFLQERVNELSKPSADELRDAYRARVSEFTTPASINFALIEIRPESSSEADIAQAMATAASVRDRATGGEDFAELARDHSDNAAYARRGGALPEMMIPLEKGAYAIAEVEQAAWDTPAGEVGPMLALERNGEQRFYLVKTIEKNERTVRSFQEVQASISNTLRQEKQDAIMEGYFADLQGDLSTPDPETQQRMFETALEIAMQKYDLWRDEAGVESSAGNG